MLKSELKLIPGGNIVEQGIHDLEQQQESVPALLACQALTRLRELGLVVPDCPWPEPEIRMYMMLAREFDDDAHSRYNALRRLLLSFIKTANSPEKRSDRFW